MAISEATSALQLIAPEISLSRDYCYQFANRIAFAWKIASTGVPVAMIYLGFIGDARIISHIDDCFNDAREWRKSFTEHTGRCFPPSMYDREINCGAASFWLLVRHLQVLRQSPPITQRRNLVSKGGPI
jgi:hypothetical protein